jgi:hypothetical protein
LPPHLCPGSNSLERSSALSVISPPTPGNASRAVLADIKLAYAVGASDVE